MKICLDELLSKCLGKLDKFEAFLIDMKSKYVKNEKNSTFKNEEVKINLKNFPFQSFKLIKQINIGCTDLITINIKLSEL